MEVNGRIRDKHGFWYCVVYWRDEAGKRHFKEKSTKLPVNGNKRKADAFLKNWITEIENELKQTGPEKKFQDIEQMSFAEYSLYWLDSIEGNVDEVTFTWYKGLIDKHVIPYFSERNLKVGEITSEVLQLYFNEKKRSGRIHGEGGLSPRTLKALKVLLGNILNMAYAANGKFNPIQNVKIPKREKRPATFYSVEQCNALLTAIQKEPIYWLVKATLMLGLRRSEVLGLQWDAVDFKKRTICIKRTVVRKVDNTICEKESAKSRASARVYHMPNAIYDLFQDVLEEEKKNQEFFGNTYVKTPYIFKWANGEPYAPSQVSRLFSQVLKRYNLPPIRFHDLRHSCASILYSAGMGIKEIQAWLGHSSSRITMDVYTHLFQDSNEQISRCIDSIFGDDTVQE